MVDLPAPMSDGSEPERFSEAPIIELGQWYWVKDDEIADEYKEQFPNGEWLGCVMIVGSNFIELRSPQTSKYSHFEERVHLNDFFKKCRRELDPRGVIHGRVMFYKTKTERLLMEIRDITANLGVAPTTGIEQEGEARSLSVLNAQTGDMKSYKRSLVKAQEKTLPSLFEEVEDSSKKMTSWMKAEILPIQAAIGPMKNCMESIEERIFHVELYAGLTEEVVQVRDGKPAALQEKVRLMQGRLYMDEECLIDYDAGGMSFKAVKDFDRWIARTHNMASILPHQRCVVAFRVRRNAKEHGELTNFFQIFTRAGEDEADKITVFYLRNGEQLFRLSTKQQLRDTLFPDLSEFDFSQPMMARIESDEVKQIMKVSEWEERKERRRLAEEKRKVDYEAYEKAKKSKDHPHHKHMYNPHDSFSWDDRDRGKWEPFNSTSVYYDEAKKSVEDDMKYYNRVVLILQGLFDRSPVFAPHFPAQLWTQEGFNRVVELIYDRDRALYAGEKPDFETFRAQCNKLIKPGCVVIGMKDAWLKAEKEKEEKAGGPKYDRYGGKISRYSYYSDPGPGFLAVVSSIKGRKVTCEYTRHRERAEKSGSRYYRETVKGKDQGDPMQEFFTADISVLFNASAYTPGDYKMFLADPRTRAEYIKWAPFLLGSEDFAAGKRKAEKDRRQHK